MRSRVARLLAELRRRRVFRVAAAYTVVGWLLIQVAATTFPHLNLPAWSVSLVIVFVAIGFPVAVVLAWAFELTPEGFQRTRIVAPQSAGAGGAAAAAGSDRTGTVAADPGAGTSDRYVIHERLGAGAMGVVHRALDSRLQREVAIKFLPESMAADPVAADRFLQEARAAAALNHPNITTLYAIDEMDDRPCLVMELVRGETLEARLARSGPVPVDDVVAIASQVAAGLSAAHARGIVHRDIKPANLMLTGDGSVKIMDFGIARLPGGPARTQAGSTLGSAAYMSPEQVRGASVDGRADVWSLGVVLYEMLTGALPFPGDNEHTVLHGVLHVDPEPVVRLRPDAPPWLADTVSAMLSRAPTSVACPRPGRRRDASGASSG
jgi:hypothetical protein